jgi:signal peptidase II
MKQRLRHLIYFILLVVIDQISKYFARMTLQKNGSVSIIPGILKLQYHENTGAVWGILTGKTEFLTVLSILLSVLLFAAYFKIPQKRRYLPIQIIWVFIMAGALGNFIDRITLKYVVDFIYFELINFPIFNLADSYLTVSSILLLILCIFYYKDEDFDFLDGLLKKKGNKEASQEEEVNEKNDESNG